MIFVDSTELGNLPPVAVDDFDSTNYMTNVIVPVLTNDYSNNGDSIVLTGVVTPPASGTVVVNADGTITYVPNGNATVTDTFTYQICDANALNLCDTATVVIYVRPFNVPPIALPINATACLGTPLGIDMGASTTDPHGNRLTYSFGPVPNGATVLQTSTGALVFVSSTPGTYTIPYTVCNHSAQPVPSLCASNLITVTVINCNTTPNDSIHANNDGMVTAVNVPATINELGNDYYPHYDSLTVSVVTGPSLPGATYVINANGTITYTSPTSGRDSIVYQICDPSPLCATATIYIYVDSFPLVVTNYPPVAVNDYDSTNYGVSVIVPVLNNDYSNNGDSIVNSGIVTPPTGGTAVVDSNGMVTYIPGPNAGATDTFTYRTCDYGIPTLCDTATVVIYFRNFNVPPLALPIRATACLGTPLGIDMAASTTDPHGNPMTYTFGPVPNGATVLQTGNGALVFVSSTPGTYTIPYTVCNHSLQALPSLCSSSVITVTVINCNTTPNDSIHANNDGMVTSVNVPANINELGNDYYPHSDSLTVSVVTGPSLPGATYVINPNGTITYTSPTPGRDSIVYQICDPSPLCATATIYIYVDTLPLIVTNYSPVAVNDYDSTTFGVPVIVPVLNNDYDNNGDSIVNGGIVTPPADGTVVVNPNGTVTYTPGNTVVSSDTFIYRTCDFGFPALCDTATVVIYFRNFNVPPVASPVIASVCYKASIGINVASGTTDPHGNPMTYSYGTITGPGSATLNVTGNGAVVFSSNTPGVYFIPYTVCNHSPQPINTLCASSYIEVKVIDCGHVPNDSIQANNDQVVTTVNTTTTINELANDYYPNPATLTVTIVSGPSLPGATGVVNPNGTITYNSPTQGRDSIVYTICDPAPLCSTATIYIYVDSVPVEISEYPPVAVDDFDSTNYQTTVVVPVISNDYSNSGDTIKVISVVTPPADGTATIDSNGNIIYVPFGQPGTSDTFTYQICDLDAPTLCDTAQVVIYIRNYNVPPVALPQTVYTCKTQFVGIDVAGSTTDPHGNPMTYTYGAVTPAGGSYVVRGNGTINFSAASPGTYTIPYTVCNHSALAVSSLCASNVITVIVTNCDSITSNGDSIKANPDGVVTSVNTHTVINELGNDFYPNPDSLTVTVLQGPGLPGSTYVINQNGTITYTSPVSGVDSIVYQICDPAPLCSVATIYIYVDTLPNVVVNYPPVAVDDHDSTSYGVPVVVPVLINDYSNNGDSIVLTAIPCSASLGTAVMNANGTITYTPGASAYTTDTFCYKICDYGFPNLCDTAQVVIYINNNVPPLAFKINASTCKTQAIGIDVAGATVDPRGLPMNYSYGTVSGPGASTLAITGNGAIVFAASTPGTYVIPYTVCNTNAACATNYITVSVVNCPLVSNDSIQANNDGVVTNTNVATVINELGNDFYPDPSVTVSIVQGPSLPGATFVLNANGTITYTSPVAGEDSIVYTICDPAPLCSTATIYIFVDTTTHTITNYPPVAVNDYDSTDYGVPGVVPVLNNDYDNNGNAIVLTAIPCQPGLGTASINGNGTITYVPGPQATSTDTFCYKICDAGFPNLCDTAQVVIYIKPLPFSLANDTQYICGTDTINMAVLNKAVEQNGVVLTVTGIGPVTPGNLGTATYTDSVVSFHAVGTTGTVRFNYYVCDNEPHPFCDTASIILYIGSCPPPHITPVIDTTLENTPDTVCLSGLVTSTTPWHIAGYCNPQNGTVTSSSGDTCFTYVPSHNFVGNDTFCVVVCNGNGCDTARVIITVIDSTIKAIAESCDRDTMNANSKLVLDVLANDIIPAAADTIVTVSVAPANGAAVVNPDNTITYTPNKGYEGTEQFTYQVCAETGRYKFCDTADICVTITGPCFIPNAFSPNGDGVNDTYVIPCNDKYPGASIMVYDRWGMEVWASNGHYLNDFDGHNKNGIKLPDGTYYVIYTYNDGSGKSEAKFVVITR